MTDSRPPYLDPALSPRHRAADLVGRMTLEEKVSQMVHTAPAIERLGVCEYNWWNECLHGVGRAGIATVFPQAIGLAATWNVDLIHRVAVAISDEARAKHHDGLRRTGRSEWYFGLTFWSPTINIFRDPRWGRGQETYGEDPYLTARLAVAFVRGLQGEDPRWLKLVATPKHFAVHSGPEKDRHGFDAVVSPRDLRETYLPAFEACVREGGAWSVMSAYNRTNGEPCGASPTLLQKILRDEWGFQGYVVSDCGAIADIYLHHRVVDTPAQAAALAVRAGGDLNCGDTYCALTDAVLTGLIDETALDRALVRLFEARARLGMFDPPESVPHASIPIEVNDCAAHRALAREAAEQSFVLLKNDGPVLPLRTDVCRVAVIGPNADDVGTLLGNYSGTPSHAVTPLQGIRQRAGSGAEVRWARGCELIGPERDGFDQAVAAAQWADVAIVVLGLSPRLEGEEGEENLIDRGGDRLHIDLPGVQEDLLRAVVASGTPVVLVLHGGSAIAVNWAAEHVAAILMSWYGGEEAGSALAAVLWGDTSPAGRLPITFYRSLRQVPPFEDYAMAGRTYRFLADRPLYPFGHGMSYTSFAYTGLALETEGSTASPVGVRVAVTNVGDRESDEVVQLYVTDVEASAPVPLLSLQGFRRLRLAPGQTAEVHFVLAPRQLACYDDDGRPWVEPGAFSVWVGGGQPGAGAPGVAGQFRLSGDAYCPTG
ncbi:MAG TPA: glycoside hydrolase family 3 C-terminal domain-containing protein [Chthonomonadales bacterium]|nr:glycoside hydrolase family 3 C-terminal domain-containing protein [Chthonomonadales bacterium]